MLVAARDRFGLVVNNLTDDLRVDAELHEDGRRRVPRPVCRWHGGAGSTLVLLDDVGLVEQVSPCLLVLPPQR